MKIETIRDIIQWSRRYHREIARRLAASISGSEKERLRMLMRYLADHERGLIAVLDKFQEHGELSALNTWCYDYLESWPIEKHPQFDKPFVQMDTGELVGAIEHEHNQIVALYRHIREQVDSASAQELMDELISLEEHSAMQAVQSANRFEDL
ncbi:MAG: ATPase [Halioglobus sp.]|nr:ATPase [Halioglobus sp.]